MTTRGGAISKVLNILDNMIAEVNDEITVDKKENGVFMTEFDTRKNHYETDIRDMSVRLDTKLAEKSQTESGIQKQKDYIAEVTDRVATLERELSGHDAATADLTAELEKTHSNAQQTFDGLSEVEAKLKDMKSASTTDQGTFKGGKVLNTVNKAKEKTRDTVNELALKITNVQNNAESTKENYKHQIQESDKDISRQENVKAKLEAKLEAVNDRISGLNAEIRENKNKLHKAMTEEKKRKLNYLKNMAKDTAMANELRRATDQLDKYSSKFFLQFGKPLPKAWVARALKKLHEESKEFKNGEFDNLANTIQFALQQQPSSGYTSKRCIFKPVIEMIDSMQSELNNEQQEDNKLKESCLGQLESTMIELNETAVDNRAARDGKNKAEADKTSEKNNLSDATNSLIQAEDEKAKLSYDKTARTNKHREQKDIIAADQQGIEKANAELENNGEVKKIMADLKKDADKKMAECVSAFEDDMDAFNSQINEAEVEIATQQTKKKVAQNAVTAASQALESAQSALESGIRRFADLNTTLRAQDITCWSGQNEKAKQDPEWDFEDADDGAANIESAKKERMGATETNHKARSDLRAAEKEALIEVSKDLRSQCKDGNVQRR